MDEQCTWRMLLSPVKSSMQKTVALSVTEAELMAAVSCTQDMMYVKRILESLGLLVKLPMILEIDNKGTVYLQPPLGGPGYSITILLSKEPIEYVNC